MELFSIQCTTCRVRLKVKDESIIGDILACPKCGSMVHVTPPDDWRQGSAPVAAAASAVVPAKPSAPLAVPATSPAPQATAPVSAPPALPVQTPAAVVEQVPAEAAMTLEGAAAIVPTKLGSRLPADWMLWAAGLGAGIVVGATVWLLAIGRESEQSAVASAPRATAASPSTPAAPQPAADAAPQQPADKNAPVADRAATTAEVAGDPAPATSAPAEPEAAVVSAPAEHGTDEKTAEPVAVTPPVEPRGPAIKLEPAAASPDSEAAGPEPTAASEPTEPDAAPADAADKKATQPATALSESDVQARMDTGLAEVRFAKVPLVQFVQFVGDCTALRIAIDEAALAKANLQRSMPISVHLRDTTAGVALKSVLEPLGLTCVARGATLVVTVAEPAR